MTITPVRRTLLLAALLLIALLLVMTALPQAARAQGEPLPLRVEAAVTGELSAAAPTAIYTFNALESLRMGFVFDLQGDMAVTLTVLGQDGQTVLAGSTGANNNGVIATFPAQGTYFVALTATEGAAATYRLMIDADPPLPTNAFVLQTFLMAGTGTTCVENEPTVFLTPTEDLNICYVVDLVQEPTEVTVQWWTPDGQIVAEETNTFDSSTNLQPVLSGIVYSGQPFPAGWWQAHILIGGELAHIQWVPVLEP